MNFTARLKKEWSKLKQSKAALPPDAELDVDLYPRVGSLASLLVPLFHFIRCILAGFTP